MSFFVYVSHKDKIHALARSQELMEQGHFPFVPQLNRWVHGMTDAQWENYFKMWLFRCDALWKTQSFRQHEVDWAVANNIPVVTSFSELGNIKVPPFAELGKEFGMKCASMLPKNEEWRRMDEADVKKQLTNLCGLGAQAIDVGVLALKAWDRRQRG